MHRNTFLLVLVVLLLMCFKSTVQAQPPSKVKEEYIIEHIKNENIEYEIYSINLIEKGYLFIGTDRGVFFFDGTSIKPIHPDHIGKNKDIIGLIRVSKNALLGLPYWGKVLHVSNESKFCQIEQPDYTKSNYKITSAYLFNDSIVYLLCTDYFNSGSLLTYNLHSNKLKLSNKKYMYKQYFTDFLFPTEKMKQQSDLYQILSKQLESINESNIGILGNEHLAINSAIYKKTKSGPVLLKDFLPYKIEGRILSIFKISDSLYYFAVVGKNHGLYRINYQKLECLYNLDDVTGVQINEHNILYFSTLHNGLFRINLNNRLAKQLSLQESISIQNIQYYPNTKQTLLADKTGNIYDVNLQQNTLTKLVVNKHNKITNTLFLSNDPNHFCDGRFIYNLSKTRIISHQKEGLKVVHLLKSNDTFYNIGNNYMWKLHKPTFTNKFELIRSDRYINSALISENDTILFATDKGLLYTVDNTINHYSSNSVLDDETILHLSKEENTYYYTTPKNVYIENRNTRRLTRIEHLSSTQAISCIPYKNSILFIHESGFLKFDSKGIILDRFEIPNYTIDKKCIGAYKIEDTIFLYNQYSIYYIPLTEKNTQITPQSLVFRSINYGSDSLNFPKGQINLTHINNSTLEIVFDIFYLSNSRIKAVLINESSNSSRILSINNNSILLDNLNPGGYTLNLYVDNYKLKTLVISLSYPWYRSIWFISLLTLFIIGMLYNLVFSILKRHNKKKLNEILQQNQLLRLETQSKLNQLKPHFIFNALMPLQHYLITSDKEKGQSYLKKLSSMLRQLMNLTRNELNSIQDEIRFAELYLETQQVEKSHQFTYQIKHSISNSNLTSLYLPSLMIQPLIENAIVHGASAIKSGNILIEFNLDQNDNYLAIKIVDNGPGFNLSEINPKNTNALNIIIERVNILKKLHPKTHYSVLKEENTFTQKITLPLTSKS